MTLPPTGAGCTSDNPASGVDSALTGWPLASTPVMPGNMIEVLTGNRLYSPTVTTSPAATHSTGPGYWNA